jgi:demethylspheroidene O-methyltransferase
MTSNGADSRLSFLDRGRELRNRLLASPRFRRIATRFPLTRWIARRRARRVFDLCAGFVYSQVLLACVKLRVFEILAEGPQSVAALSQRLTLPLDATRRLLVAAASLQLVERRSGNRFGLGETGAILLGDASITAMIEHHPLLYADLADPLALLRGESRGTELARYWAYAARHSPERLATEDVAAYSALMSSSQGLVAEEVLDAWPFDAHRCCLDVGGGDGTFLVSAARRAPGLRLMLFDLPPVAARARDRFAAAGLSARATALGGDFQTDPLPVGADLVTLVRVVHDHDDKEALALLQAVRRALPDDGVLLVAEPMSGTSGAEPITDAYFAFYLLAMGSGRPRSPEELEDLLHAAGFRDVRTLPTRMPLQTRVLVARP